MTYEQKKAAGGNQTAEVSLDENISRIIAENQSGQAILEAALYYASVGFPVLPVRRDLKRPYTTHGYKDATTDPEQIRSWWQTWPKANVAIITGARSGVWVLDVDGDEGEASLRTLEAEHGTLPETFEVITGGGGRHIYFQWEGDDDFTISAGQLGYKLDVRGNQGGYVVAPPSLHASGKRYEISVDSTKGFAPAPSWLRKKLNNSVTGQSGSSPGAWKECISGAVEGKRNSSVASMAGKLLSAGVADDDVMKTCLGLNNGFHSPLAEEEVRRTVKSIIKTDFNRRQSEGDMDLPIVSLDQVEMKPINWLWPERIARGKITVIAGNPGLGKSQITAFLAAKVSTGQNWPDRTSPGVAGHVLILSSEDDPHDTIKPRLLAAGGDDSKCHILEMIKGQDSNGQKTQRPFDLKRDMARMQRTLESRGNIRLIIIDPISAYLGDTDSHNNAEIRGLLAPLADMAMQRNVAVVLVTHFNKSKDQDMIARVIGSIGIVAAARAGYAVIKDEQNPDTRYFIPLKNNVGNDRDGFAFHIVGVTLSEGIHTSYVSWHEGTVDVQAIMHPVKETQTNGARTFLEELLSRGPMSAKDIFEEAEGMGHSKAAMQRAATALKVFRKKRGMKEGWIWRLPDTEDVEDNEDDMFLERHSSMKAGAVGEDNGTETLLPSTPSQPSGEVYHA